MRNIPHPSLSALHPHCGVCFLQLYSSTSENSLETIHKATHIQLTALQSCQMAVFEMRNDSVGAPNISLIAMQINVWFCGHVISPILYKWTLSLWLNYGLNVRRENWQILADKAVLENASLEVHLGVSKCPQRETGLGRWTECVSAKVQLEWGEHWKWYWFLHPC